MKRELTRYEKVKAKFEKRLGWGWNLIRTMDPDPDMRFMIRIGSNHTKRGWCIFEARVRRQHFIIFKFPEVD